jgi:hypothetical protein
MLALFFGNTETEFGEVLCDTVINESFLLDLRDVGDGKRRDGRRLHSRFF